jgi:hypothetical protein
MREAERGVLLLNRAARYSSVLSQLFRLICISLVHAMVFVELKVVNFKTGLIDRFRPEAVCQRTCSPKNPPSLRRVFPV